MLAVVLFFAPSVPHHVDSDLTAGHLTVIGLNTPHRSLVAMPRTFRLQYLQGHLPHQQLYRVLLVSALQYH